MENCTKCNSENKVKNGFTISKRQNFKCKDCGCSFSVLCKSGNMTKKDKDLAKSMYLEGLGFRKIGRILNFSHVAIYNCIRKIGEKEKEEFYKNKPKMATEKIIEIDEIHTYLHKKKLRMDLDSG